MNPKIKRLWVKALESGEYKQGKGQLRRGAEFCCLGVLCNLHAQAHPEIAAKQTDPGVYLGCTPLLPLAVTLWAGLKTINPVVTIEGFEAVISEQNDLGIPFKQIAKAIRKQL